MKALIAIISCENNAALGYPQSQRDTWLKDVSKHPGLEYRFFYGDNRPTEEDENTSAGTYAGVENAYPNHRYVKSPMEFKPQADEVVLENTPDDYGHHAYKTRNKIRWALNQGYEYILTCNDDLYVHLGRMMISGFQSHDFLGRRATDSFIHGGPGIWLSRKSAEILVSSPINTYGGDGYMAQSLVGKVPLYFEERYAEWPTVPTRENDVLTSHLIVSGQRMYDVHRGIYA